jgi:hypothetical protein
MLHSLNMTVVKIIILSLTSLIFDSQVLSLLVDKASVNKVTRLEYPV